MTRIALFFSIFLISIFVFPCQGFSQQKEGKLHKHAGISKEIEDFKIKFLIEEMELEKSKQEKFSELYRQMQAEKSKVFSDMRNAERRIKDKKEATEKEYLEANEQITDARIKLAEIEKKYDEKFSAVLSKKQLFKMKEAEKLFREKMHKMRQSKHKKGQKK